MRLTKWRILKLENALITKNDYWALTFVCKFQDVDLKQLIRLRILFDGFAYVNLYNIEVQFPKWNPDQVIIIYEFKWDGDGEISAIGLVQKVFLNTLSSFYSNSVRFKQIEVFEGNELEYSLRTIWTSLLNLCSGGKNV